MHNFLCVSRTLALISTRIISTNMASIELALDCLNTLEEGGVSYPMAQRKLMIGVIFV